jgi:hypothetical protein
VIAGAIKCLCVAIKQAVSHSPEAKVAKRMVDKQQDSTRQAISGMNRDQVFIIKSVCIRVSKASRPLLLMASEYPAVGAYARLLIAAS